MNDLRPDRRSDLAPEGAASERSARRRTRSAAEITILVAWAWAALLFGGVISLLHLLHNRVDGLRDAFLLWVFFAQVWGLAGAGAATLALVARRLLRRNANRAPGVAGPSLARDLAWALVLFHLPFFLTVVLYGRTYDHFAFAGPPRTAAGMVALLAAAAILIAATVVLVSIFLARRLAARATAGSLPRLARTVAVASLGLHLAVAAAFRLAPEPAEPAGGTFRPLRAADRASSRVVLVGLDGADWRVLRPLVDRGELPAFRRLMEEGAWGELATLPDTNSAVIWASIYTGKRPRQHGVLDFYRMRLPGMAGRGVFPVHRTFTIEIADLFGSRGLLERRIVDRSLLGAPPLWEILDDLGVSVGVVDGYHFSVPARPLATPGGFFYSYALNVLSQRPGWKPEALAPRDVALLFQPPEALRHYAPHAGLGDFHWQTATLLDALAAEGQPDFLNFYTHEPDSAQHWNWKWFEPERFLAVDPAELDCKAQVIPDLYREFDRFLGTLLSRLEPGTTLAVVSDHGHSPTIVHKMYSQHRHGPPGILLLWGDQVRRGVEIERAHVYDVTPTVLHLLGLPIGADMAGSILHQVIARDGAAAAPERTIESYDAFAPARVETGGPDLSKEELERLRALGYL
ncbi:MAG TPA: alkaline phosphatase family protein [Thermoanaerobaculia bacterium]|nr:alkaline phosphatase family protein [Thermoanaerobaculia bacterium]